MSGLWGHNAANQRRYTAYSVSCHRFMAARPSGSTAFTRPGRQGRLRLITLPGLVMFVGNAALGLWALWVALFTEDAAPGWASTVVPMYFLGSVQLLGIGIIGEYLRKLYQEVKARPRFIIEERC
jgi:hypothetical protein